MYLYLPCLNPNEVDFMMSRCTNLQSFAKALFFFTLSATLDGIGEFLFSLKVIFVLLPHTILYFSTSIQ